MSNKFAPVILIGAAAGLAALAARKKTGEPQKGEDSKTEEKPEVPEVDDDSLSDEEKCNKFLEQIYVEPTEEDELPIAEIEVDQKIVPKFVEYAKNVLKEKGVIDIEFYPRFMARLALEEVVPVCNWEINADGELTSPDDERAKKIYNSLIPLAKQIAIEQNATVGISPAKFEQFEEQPKETDFEEG